MYLLLNLNNMIHGKFAQSQFLKTAILSILSHMSNYTSQKLLKDLTFFSILCITIT